MPKKETQNTGQEPEKIVTKYDLKMQRRKEEKEKAAREEKVSRIIGILVVVALACIVLSFPHSELPDCQRDLCHGGR